MVKLGAACDAPAPLTVVLTLRHRAAMDGKIASREEAGRKLAELLSAYGGRDDVVVLALPRGGVPVGYEIARALRASLQVFFVRKIGVPMYPELAMGAIASGDVLMLDANMVREFGLSRPEVEDAVARSRNELERQEQAFRPGRPAMNLSGRIAILTDDGVATGYTMLAAIDAAKRLGAAKVLVATGVAPPSTIEQIRSRVDEVACLMTPRDFRAVGLFYEDFSQVTDQEVKRLLELASPEQEAR